MKFTNGLPSHHHGNGQLALYSAGEQCHLFRSVSYVREAFLIFGQKLSNQSDKWVVLFAFFSVGVFSIAIGHLVYFIFG